VSIIPRGRALGVTMYLPEGDRHSISKAQISSMLCSLYGGRIAEEIIFGSEKVTTGASNDIMRATQLARDSVAKWGLSDTLGPILYSDQEEEVFLGRSVTQTRHVSEETSRRIDQEVRKVLDAAYARSTQLLTDNIDKLHLMAETLLKYETIDAKQIDEIMQGREPGPPSDWWDGPQPKKDPPTVDPTPTPIGDPAAQS
jgi:cell division protease FtsH